MWKVKRNADGSYIITDEHGVLRGSYATGDNMATHLAFALQRIAQVEKVLQAVKDSQVVRVSFPDLDEKIREYFVPTATLMFELTDDVF